MSYIQTTSPSYPHISSSMALQNKKKTSLRTLALAAESLGSEAEWKRPHHRGNRQIDFICIDT